MSRKPIKSAETSAAPIATANADPVGFAPLPEAERPPLGALVAGTPANPPAAPATPASPPVPATPASPPVLDAHGHDPAAYQWVPVLRKRRADGWSPQKQRDYIGALADTGVVETSAREVGMSVASCYRLRRAPGAESFAAAWDAAIHQASRKLVDIAFDRAINGSDEPVFDKQGRRVGRRMKTNDRLLMFLLRNHLPERYGHAAANSRASHGGPPAPPLTPPVAEAIATLAPVEPPDPHLLMPPEALEDALVIADMGDGELPHWHRDPVEPDYCESPLGEEFERLLEAAKRESNGLAPLAEHEEDKDGENAF